MSIQNHGETSRLSQGNHSIGPWQLTRQLWRSQAPFGVKTSFWQTATWSGARRPSPCHAAGIFQPPWGEQRWGDAKNWKTCCWVGFAIRVWWDCATWFWDVLGTKMDRFCEHKSVLCGGRVFVQSKRLRFFEWTDTLNSEAELGWDAKTRKCSSPLKVEQNCPALWRIKGPKVPHFRRGIPLGRT